MHVWHLFAFDFEKCIISITTIIMYFKVVASSLFKSFYSQFCRNDNVVSCRSDAQQSIIPFHSLWDSSSSTKLYHQCRRSTFRLTIRSREKWIKLIKQLRTFYKCEQVDSKCNRWNDFWFLIFEVNLLTFWCIFEFFPPFSATTGERCCATNERHDTSLLETYGRKRNEKIQIQVGFIFSTNSTDIILVSCYISYPQFQ